MRFFLMILICVMVRCGAAAQAPVLSFEVDEYDFGDIPELGGSVQYRFVYANTGDSPLVITDVKTTCGCTSPAWSKEPVAPGRKGYVDVSFDPRDRTGAFTKSIIVSSNAASKPVTLYITGSVIRRPTAVASEFPFAMDDLRLKSLTVNIGKIPSNQTAQGEIQVINPTKANIVVEPDEDNAISWITIDPKPKILKPGERGVIRTKFNAKASGMYAFVKLDVPVLVNGQRHLLHFRGFVDEVFSDGDRANPPAMEASRDVYGTVSADSDTVRFRIRYANTGKSTLHIRHVMCPSGVEIDGGDMQAAPGQSGEIVLKAPASSIAAGRKYSVSVYANIPGAPPERFSLILN